MTKKLSEKTPLSELSKTQKRALAKTLKKSGFSCKKIGAYIDVHPSTISLWVKKAVTKEEEEIAREFTTLAETQRQVGLIKVLERINEITPQVIAVSDLIEIAKYLDDRPKLAPSNNQANVQVNFNESVKKIEKTYGEL
jgi:IS30 family transposase